ncbi:MAG TPA: protein kinase [Pyrinomonadaceae bacterium]|jgi:serine/threonine protein kinase/Flp pilus assembly protein TadD|nr:protein kinase [Pyrinomonadaceae bacterium]
MSLEAGTRLGRYEIRSSIGKGGMGEVYLAQDSQLERTVALKILPPEVASDQQRMHRFVREGKATAALSHPNIAHIYEIGEADGMTFIAMEYVEGQTLRQYMKSTRIRLDDALDIAVQVASALAEAHEAGIVHRDIKPENIMLRPDGYVKLLDFGLAKLIEKHGPSAPNSLDEAPTLLIHTNPGVLMGTVTYMSPEQARGLEVDGRTDIWSLGVVLYEMVAGRVPFTGVTTTDMLVSILEHRPRKLSRLVQQIPIDLDRIISKAMAKRRESRYKSARDFVAAVKALRQEMDFKAKLARSLNVDLESADAVTEYDTKAAHQPGHEPSASSKSSVRTSLSARRRRSSRKAIDSLAILPLVNASGEHETEYFSDGITESIINNLSHLPKLRVMARSTVFRYKDKEADPLQVGRELNVRAVLTGRVLHHEDNLLIQTELVDAIDGSRLWGEQYNRKMTDIFNIQEEIAREISEKLRFRLTGEEQKQLAKRHTDNPEAYRLYLKGRYNWNKRTPEGFKKGIEHFKEAIDIDSGYALAYAGLADSYNMLGNYSELPPREAFPRARTAAIKALRIDDTLAEARASLAYAINGYDWNWAGAASEFKRAIELKPNYATAHYWYATTHLAAVGKLDEALSEIMQAKELDPLSLIINTNLGWIYYFARRYEDAIKQIRKALEIDENFNVAYFKLGQVYERQGNYEEAITQYRRAMQLSSNLWIMPGLGHALAMSGRRDEAHRILNELIAASGERYVSPYFIAEVYRGLGDLDKTFEWLEKAYEDRSDWLVWLGIEPALDGLRSDPRFIDLVRRVGLPQQQ